MSHHPRAELEHAASAIAVAGRELAALGYTPATSGNFSMRLGPERIAVTVSGRDKGRLGPADVIEVDLRGRALDPARKPSAETLLHCQIYARWPQIGAVLHTHSLAQTVASRLYAQAGHLRLAGYELLKAFRGYDTHAAAMELKVFANSQDMPALCRQVEHLLDQPTPVYGYLIEGHGIYTWGIDLAEARRHLDAFEFLIRCELEMRKLSR
jgi:methylthioribulose-1-phosphate dehydratase